MDRSPHEHETRRYTWGTTVQQVVSALTKTFRLYFSIEQQHLSDSDVRLRHTSLRKMFEIKAVEIQVILGCGTASLDH